MTESDRQNAKALLQQLSDPHGFLALSTLVVAIWLWTLLGRNRVRSGAASIPAVVTSVKVVEIRDWS